MDVAAVREPVLARYLSVGKQSGYYERQPHLSPDGFPGLPESLPLPDHRPAALPVHPRVQFGRFYRQGRYSGTDYHDVMDLGGNRFAITMADISGAGASTAAAMLHAAVRSRAGRHDDSGSLLHQMSEHFRYLWHDSLVATGLCAVVDPRRRTLQLASAGHQAPLLARRDEVVKPMSARSSMPLGNTGLILTAEYELHSGDRLLFYTGGVTHQGNGEGERYGVGRLSGALGKAQGFPPAVAVDCLGHDIERFAVGNQPDGDQTLLLVGVY